MASIIDDILTRARSGPLKPSMDEFGVANPPITTAQLLAAETHLGFPLPAVLRDIYLHIGNGSFGPGYGLFPLDSQTASSRDQFAVVELYRSFRQRSSPLGAPWAERLLPICHWGCQYFSYLDCALPSTPVMSLNEECHGHGPWGCAFSLHDSSFENWMRRWLSGENLWDTFDAHGEMIRWNQIVEAQARIRGA